MLQRLHRSLLIALMLCCAGTILHAQERYYQNWNFGPMLGLNFADDPVAPFTSSINGTEGCSSISDPRTGELLFYTDGATVWNRNHNVMLNGSDLLGNLSCTQSSLIVPHPADRTRYFIFTQDGTTAGGPRDPNGYGLQYSVVDMKGDAAMGAVVEKNISLLRTASEKLTAVRHPNGCDYWVIAHELGNNRFYAWLVSRDGVHSEPVLSETGKVYPDVESGSLKASPDGKLLFATYSFYNVTDGELFPFDARTGIVGERIALIPGGYSSSFSPDNTLLYSAAGDSLYQYDLTVDPARIVTSRTLLNQPEKDRVIYGMQIGPDRKIYCIQGPASYSSLALREARINVINSPDVSGANADYQNLLTYARVRFFSGLPNCIDGYLGDADVGDGIPASVSSDTVICAGETARLEVKGGLWYTWEKAEGLDCDTCRVVDVRPEQTTTYSVIVYGLNFCPGLDTLQVTVQVEENTVDAGSDQVICQGESVQLKATEGGIYNWTPSEGLSCDDCPDPVATPEKTTTYYVVKSNAQGRCPALDSVTVTVHPSPTAEAGASRSVCQGDSLVLEASGGERYEWDASPDLSCLDCPDPVVRPGKSGWYYVTVWNDKDCWSRDSVEVIVHPELILAADGGGRICQGESLVLNVDGGVRWEWSPSDGLSCTDCPNPVASPEKRTVYRVRGWSAEGCVAEDSVTVDVRSGRVRLRIGREYHGGPGDTLEMVLSSDGPTEETDISELDLVLTYDSRMMRMDVESFRALLASTGLSGWDLNVDESIRGELRIRLRAPAGSYLVAGDTLLRFQGAVYLSGTRDTELPFTVRSNSLCYDLESSSGRAEVDSICGLEFRLIELGVEKYVSPTVYPNPARGRVHFEFGLGLDGETELEVFDGGGRRVGILVREYLDAGRYSVEWDAESVSGGVYWYRLRSGDWVKSGALRIER